VTEWEVGYRNASQRYLAIAMRITAKTYNSKIAAGGSSYIRVIVRMCSMEKAI
jgi:hypothetical protein